MQLFDALTGRVQRMSHVYRYSSYANHRPENVAEHSWWVSFISYIIGVDLLDKGKVVAIDRLCQRAIMHDLNEALSGDIIRPYKYSSPELLEELKRADRTNIFDLADEIGGPPRNPKEEETSAVADAIEGGWIQAKAPDLEGDIVRFADMVAVFLYCRGERLAGNTQMDHVMKELYETWMHKFHEHAELGQYCDDLFPGGRFNDYHRHWELGAWMPMPGQTRLPIMRDHSEGPVVEHDFRGEGDGNP